MLCSHIDLISVDKMKSSIAIIFLSFGILLIANGVQSQGGLLGNYSKPSMKKHIQNNLRKKSNPIQWNKFYFTNCFQDLLWSLSNHWRSLSSHMWALEKRICIVCYLFWCRLFEWAMGSDFLEKISFDWFKRKSGANSEIKLGNVVLLEP